MLKLALEAQLPLVAVSTRDTLNLADVVKELTGKKLAQFTPNGPWNAKTVYQLVIPPLPGKDIDVPYDVVYGKMTQLESTLIVVNPRKVLDVMYDAGEVPVPKPLMMKFLKAVVADTKKAEELLRGLGGCTIKEAAELCRLTMARDASLTVQGLMQTRKESFMGSKGLAQVDTAQSFYDPPQQLYEWVEKERPFFLFSDDVRLRPRGLLLDGPPGVGKTSGAKWIAERFGVPLYRMDVGGTKGRYVGDSETALLSHFARLDDQAPAVCLIDEIEKVFTETNDGGTTTSMLSQLLWWLAEHKSRVLTVMTTNNAGALPKELYREGRIDKTMLFEGLEFTAAGAFVESVLKTFPKTKWTSGDVAAVVKAGYGPLPLANQSQKRVAQATLTEAVYQHIKGMSQQ